MEKQDHLAADSLSQTLQTMRPQALEALLREQIAQLDPAAEEAALHFMNNANEHLSNE